MPKHTMPTHSARLMDWREDTMIQPTPSHPNPFTLSTVPRTYSPPLLPVEQRISELKVRLRHAQVANSQRVLEDKWYLHFLAYDRDDQLLFDTMFEIQDPDEFVQACQSSQAMEAITYQPSSAHIPDNHKVDRLIALGLKLLLHPQADAGS